MSPVASNAAEALQCITPAASYHAVNEEVLRSLLNIESRGDPLTVTRNSDGSTDVGIGGTNSIHFVELAKYGVKPRHLLDACIATYTTAWLLAKATRKHGETWQGIASFHSTTPYYNHRYQILLHNDLVRRGVKKGTLMKVPALRPSK